MAKTLTIAEAEEAHLVELQRRERLKRSESNFQLYGALALLVAAIICGVLHFTLLPGALFLSVMFIPFIIVFGIVGYFSRAEPVGIQGLSLDAIRLAQRKWIESHGFKLPVGAFDQLAFPVLLDGSAPKIYGVAQLIEASTDKLLSISLRSTPEKGYQLFGTEGEILKPVPAAV